MAPPQVLSMLAEDCKYLTTVCVKGTKGSDFGKVREWYTSITQHCSHLA
jgi:hypothetical protein